MAINLSCEDKSQMFLCLEIFIITWNFMLRKENLHRIHTCSIYSCALNVCELKMKDVRVFTSSKREEMVSLLGATQNEIAKGAMDAWTIVLQARALSYRKVSDF